MTVEVRPMGVTCNLSCAYCVTGDTPILMADFSWKPIADVVVGDKVIGFDEETDEPYKQRQLHVADVTETMQREANDVLLLRTEMGRELRITPEHPVWGVHRWRTAGSLKPGNLVGVLIKPVISGVKVDDYKRGLQGVDTIVSSELFPGIHTVYNLETTTHTYIAAGVNVHNCYQEPVRDAHNIQARYDIDKIIAQLEKTQQPFNLFGGEAFLVPIDDMERLWAYGYERWGHNGVQTNGTLITPEHIALCQKYRVHVGISIDGPGRLNRLRKVRRDEADTVTDAATAQTLHNLEALREAGVSVSCIITTHKENASRERLPELLAFMDWLAERGVTQGNLHPLEVDDPAMMQYLLTPEEEAVAFRAFSVWAHDHPECHWKPMEDVERLLSPTPSETTCFWHHCDPANTRAVYGIEGQGQLSNCGRTNKEGIDWVKADNTGYERYAVLSQTPPEYGGCQGCRFLGICGGGCPGEAIDGDWRNKTMHCELWKALLGDGEEWMRGMGMTPITDDPLREQAEQYMLEQLALGRELGLAPALREVRKRYGGIQVHRAGTRVI